MTTTPGGWTASPNPADFGGLDDRDVPGAPGVKLAPGVRAGDVADVLFHFAGQFHAHVEPLRAGQCWGFAYRPNTNARTVLSEHAAGVAIDLNAPEHPNGKRGTFTDAQVGVLRALLAGYGGVLLWGGDFTGTDDEMHVEIHGTPAQVAAVAAKLRGPSPAPAPPVHGNGHGPGPHPGNEATHAPAELGPPQHSEPGYPLPGHDGVGSAASFRAQYGDEGPHIGALQRQLNSVFSDYSELEVDDVYGGETAAVLAELAHRAAADVHAPWSNEDRAALKDADGYNVGPHLAVALAHYGIHP